MKETTILFIPFAPPPSPFVTSIRGFVFINESDKEMEVTITNIVTNAMFVSTSRSELPTITRWFIVNYRDKIPKAIKNLDNTLRFICTLITVKRLNLIKKEDIGTGEGKTQPVWNIYMFPPSRNEEIMREWRHTIRRVVFMTDSNGVGRTMKTFSCTICQSEDHPGRMCPYPDQQGWKTPAPTTSPVLDAILGQTQNTCDDRTAIQGGRGNQLSNWGRNTISRRGRN